MKYEVITTTIQALAYLKLCFMNSDSPTFCDTETDGLYGYIRTLQVYNTSVDDTVYIFDFDEVDRSQVDEYFKKLWTVWSNASYDFGSLNYTTTKFDDIQWLARIAYPKLPAFSLDAIAKQLAGDPYKNLDKSKIQKAGFLKGQYLSNTQLTYAATDVYALSIIWDNALIQKARDNFAYKVDIIALTEAIEWQQNGLPVLEDIRLAYKIDIEQQLSMVETSLGGINPRSTVQVKKALNIEGSTDKATLMRLAINENSVLAADILKARKLKNTLSNLNKYGHKKIYGRFNPAGARTGRWTCKGGDVPEYNNLQNYSRDLKGIFGVEKDSGYIILTADYSTAELRALASIYKETNMYDALMAGHDLHAYTASLIYDIPIEEVKGRQRSNAKVANFGFAFGLGAEVFIGYAFDLYGLKFSKQEALDLRAKWMSSYPAVAKYHKRCWDKMKKGNYVCYTALGKPVAPTMGTEAINAPVQGTIAEVMKLAIHYMVKADKDALKYIINSVHDSIYLVVPVAKRVYYSNILEKSMLKAWVEISTKCKLMHYKDIPMPIDVAYGYSMSDLAEDFEGGGQALSIEEMQELKDKK